MGEMMMVDWRKLKPTIDFPSSDYLGNKSPFFYLTDYAFFLGLFTIKGRVVGAVVVGLMWLVLCCCWLLMLVVYRVLRRVKGGRTYRDGCISRVLA